ncbi:MAG TPA: hypothetical protein VGE07_09425 [Herpetosiphonaceae bacterium]
MSQHTGVETPGPFADRDRAWLERELQAARIAARETQRRLQKLEHQLAETTRAYNKTVENMMEIVRENMALAGECERWRNQSHRAEFHDDGSLIPLQQVTPDEARAIRKAMARLHHPDLGGNPERMKSWNAVLDRLEDGKR